MFWLNEAASSCASALWGLSDNTVGVTAEQGTRDLKALCTLWAHSNRAVGVQEGSSLDLELWTNANANANSKGQVITLTSTLLYNRSSLL